MAYSVANTVGTVVSTVLDGQKDSSSTSLVFIGKSVVDYGQIQNENFLWLLENFSGPTEPSHPQEGQIWWDSLSKIMRVYIADTGWKTLSGFMSGPVVPTIFYSGDQWWDSTNEQLKIWNGSEWIIIGPVYSKLDGKTGALAENAFTGSAEKRTITKVYGAGDLVATISKHSEFTPNVAITGFSTVKPGIQLNSSISGLKFQGTATNADALGSISAANYMRTDITNTVSGNLAIQNISLKVGNNGQLSFSANPNGTVVVDHTALNSLLVFRSNVGGTATATMIINGNSGRVSVEPPIADVDIANKSYVDQQDVANRIATLNIANTNIDTAKKNYEFTSTGTKYQPTVYVGSDAPNNAVGVNGDIWLRFF